MKKIALLAVMASLVFTTMLSSDNSEIKSYKKEFKEELIVFKKSHVKGLDEELIDKYIVIFNSRIENADSIPELDFLAIDYFSSLGQLKR